MTLEPRVSSLHKKLLFRGLGVFSMSYAVIFGFSVLTVAVFSVAITALWAWINALL